MSTDPGTVDALQDVVRAAASLEQSRRALQGSVDRARAAGRTWAELGTALGITRQAAFKRFGRPTDPRTGETMTATTLTDELPARTEELFGWIDAGQYDRLQAVMTTETADALTREVVLDTWAAAVAETGNLVRCSATGLALPDGSPVTPGETVLGAVVGHTTLECEAGAWHGRVAFDGHGAVVGLLVVPPGTTDLPF